MARTWLLPSLLAMLFYGLWGLFPKLAVRSLEPASAVFWEVLGAAVVGLGVLAFLGGRPETSAAGVAWAAATGVAGMIGTLFFFYAARSGPISSVVSVTALYPLVTILAAVLLLGETLNAKQVLGIGFALAAILLLSRS